MSEHPLFDEVLAGLRAGDDRAAGEVWNEYVKRLKGLARRKLDGRLQGKVSDSTIALSALASFFKGNAQGRFDFHGWDDIWSLLAKIALRKCDNAFARVFGTQMRDPKREERPAPFLDGPEESRASWEAIARDPTPEQAAALHETLQELIAGLDEQQREILQLTSEGYNSAEIADKMGCSDRTVRRVVRDIQQRLTKQLDLPWDEKKAGYRGPRQSADGNESRDLPAPT